MDCSLPGFFVHEVLQARILEWVAFPFSRESHGILQALILECVAICPSPGDLPNPGIEPRSSALQADSLPSELPGKPKNTAEDSLSLLQGIFLTRNRTRVSWIAGGFFTSWATREARMKSNLPVLISLKHLTALTIDYPLGPGNLSSLSFIHIISH